ncbi:apolipoprotein N-acyltransferase [bacterium]|nr:apolipoprotein N-acyltransferase [bacterium]
MGIFNNLPIPTILLSPFLHSRRRLFPWVACVLSALLNIAIFPRLQWSWLGFVCFVPLLLLLSTDYGTRKLFFYGWLTGFLFNLGNLYWIYYVIQHYSTVHPALVVGILLLLCIVLALFWGVFLAITGIFRNRLGLNVALLVAPFLWIVLEWTRNQTTEFPWCLVGYSQYNHLRIAQMASFAGVYGLSWLLLSANAAIMILIVLRRSYYIIACSILVATVSIYGHFRIARPVGTETAKIGVIQGNVPQDAKLNYSFAESIHRKHVQMTMELIEKSKPDIIFWSEASTLFPIRTGGIWSKEIWKLAAITRIPLIIGSDTFTGEEVFNSAYLVNERGEIAGQYDKIYLVPFGEFVPLKNIFFFAGKMVPEISDFSRGTNYRPFLIRGQKVSINICFEVVFPQLSREFCLRGTTLLATITNDAWFGRTAAPYQHFAMSVMRAIENRRYLVRAANTGISGFVDPYGRILQATEIFVPASVTGEIRWVTEQTFYTRFGDWIVYLGMLVCVTTLFLTVRRKGAK